VHFGMFLMGFCAFLEVPPKMHKISWLTSNNAQNPTRNFQNIHNPMRNSQICTILRGTSKNAQNPTRNFQICTKSHEELPKMLCIFGRSSWDFAHIWKFLVGFCALL
jgi:hypothetical protein